MSLYYATYSTGTFKWCNYVVYQPPTRNYKFDTLFAQPQNLPPGTPMFRDIDNLTYRQDFTPSRFPGKDLGPSRADSPTLHSRAYCLENGQG